MSKMTKNGVTTSREKDCLRTEYFWPLGMGCRTQWDYRDASGGLHSGVAKNAIKAKEKAAAFGYLEGVSKYESL